MRRQATAARGGKQPAEHTMHSSAFSNSYWLVDPRPFSGNATRGAENVAAIPYSLDRNFGHRPTAARTGPRAQAGETRPAAARGSAAGTVAKPGPRAPPGPVQTTPTLPTSPHHETPTQECYHPARPRCSAEELSWLFDAAWCFAAREGGLVDARQGFVCSTPGADVKNQTTE